MNRQNLGNGPLRVPLDEDGSAELVYLVPVFSDSSRLMSSAT